MMVHKTENMTLTFDNPDFVVHVMDITGINYDPKTKQTQIVLKNNYVRFRNEPIDEIVKAFLEGVEEMNKKSKVKNVRLYLSGFRVFYSYENRTRILMDILDILPDRELVFPQLHDTESPFVLDLDGRVFVESTPDDKSQKIQYSLTDDNSTCVLEKVKISIYSAGGNWISLQLTEKGDVLVAYNKVPVIQINREGTVTMLERKEDLVCLYLCKDYSWKERDTVVHVLVDDKYNCPYPLLSVCKNGVYFPELPPHSTFPTNNRLEVKRVTAEHGKKEKRFKYEINTKKSKTGDVSMYKDKSGAVVVKYAGSIILLVLSNGNVYRWKAVMGTNQEQANIPRTHAGRVVVLK